MTDSHEFDQHAENLEAASSALEAVGKRPDRIPEGFLSFLVDYLSLHLRLPIAQVIGGYGTAQDEGTSLAQRKKLNFVGAGVTATDDAANNRTLVTIPGGAGGGGYATVQDEGTALAAQTTMDFAGAGVTATDDAPNSRTLVTIPGTPTGAAGGDLTGSTYPNPTVAALAITDAKVAAANKDGLAATASMRTLGTGAQQAAAGNDSRLSDARTPTGHHTTHEPGGSDAMAVDAVVGTGSLRTLGTGAQQAAAGSDSRLSDARNAKGNGSASAQVATAVDTYITGSNIPITGVVKAGTVIRWRFTLTKSAAGTVAPIWNVRVGTAASTADTARLTFTSGTVQTAAADTGWFEIEVVVVSVSSTGTITGAMRMGHKLATTGLQNVAQDQLFTATSGTFDSTLANLQIGVSVTPGTSGVFTFQTVSALLINPA